MAATTKSQADRFEQMTLAAAEGAPPGLAKYIRMFAPAIKVLSTICMFLLPWIVMLATAVHKAYQLVPINLLYAFMGLVFCFFGGTYPVLFAAIEAARLSGYENTKQAVQDIVDEATAMVKKSAEDDQIDDDHDGVADVEQIDAKALFQRKTQLVLTKCDPQKINVALGGLMMAWIGVVATLKMQFARTITLALSIADFIGKPLDLIVMPALLAVVPEDYGKWVPVMLGWVCKAAGISVAWYIQAIVSSVTSGIRGGLMFARAMITFCSNIGVNFGGLIPMLDEKKLRKQLNVMNSAALVKRAKYVLVPAQDLASCVKDEEIIDLICTRTEERLHEDTYVDEVVGWLLAALGCYFQVFVIAFAVPWWANIVMWPFGLAEEYLKWYITN